MAEVIYIISICTRMTEVTGAEEGEYTCRGENVAGEVTSISTHDIYQDIYISTHDIYTSTHDIYISTGDPGCPAGGEHLAPGAAGARQLRGAQTRQQAPGNTGLSLVQNISGK